MKSERSWDESARKPGNALKGHQKLSRFAENGAQMAVKSVDHVNVGKTDRVLAGAQLEITGELLQITARPAPMPPFQMLR